MEKKLLTLGELKNKIYEEIRVVPNLKKVQRLKQLKEITITTTRDKSILKWSAYIEFPLQTRLTIPDSVRIYISSSITGDYTIEARTSLEKEIPLENLPVEWLLKFANIVIEGKVINSVKI